MMALGRTWIAVLDDSRARFFVRELSGRLSEAAPTLHVAPRTEMNRQPETRHNEREKFILGIVATLDSACDGGACDRIMLVGPERMLSTLRKSSTDKIRARLWREMAAEPADSSEAELAERLAPHFR